MAQAIIPIPAITGTTENEGTSTYRAYAQSFKWIYSLNLNEIWVYGLGGDVTSSIHGAFVNIKNDNAGVPGSIVATLGNMFGGPTYDTPMWKNFTGEDIVLTLGTTYWINFECYPFGINWRYAKLFSSSSSQYSDGTLKKYNYGTSSWEDTTTDLLFYLVSNVGTPLPSFLPSLI